MRTAKGFIICFDSTDESSFHDAKLYYNEIQEIVPEAVRCLVATQSDKINKVDTPNTTNSARVCFMLLKCRTTLTNAIFCTLKRVQKLGRM